MSLVERKQMFEECPSCKGSGQIDIGDCEDGVTGNCPQCCGTGIIEEGE